MPTDAGFYDDGAGVERWWNGRDWTGTTKPLTTAALAPASSPVVDDVARQRNLNAQVGPLVTEGWTLEFNDGSRAVVSRRIPMSFVLNLIAFALTGGLWLIVILVRLGSPRFERLTLVVQQDGSVVRTWR